MRNKRQIESPFFVDKSYTVQNQGDSNKPVDTSFLLLQPLIICLRIIALSVVKLLQRVDQIILFLVESTKAAAQFTVASLVS